jgi:hypothetical protein
MNVCESACYPRDPHALVSIRENFLLTRSTESIKDAASTSAYAMMTYYKGNETGHIPGAFASKWWEGAALFLALLQYWHFTGDTTYNDELRVGLEWQAGDGDYMPTNYSSYLVRGLPVHRFDF